MFSENSILSWIIFLPTIGMITLLFISRAQTIKRVSLFFGVLTFVLSLYLAKPFLPMVTGGEAAGGDRESTYGQLYWQCQRGSVNNRGVEFKNDHIQRLFVND